MLRPMATALITGASAGLGAEFASLFAADGHSVVLVARRRERLEALAASLEREHKVEARVIAADLADAAAPRRIFDELDAAGVHIEFLVNNAGFGSNGPFVEADLEKELGQLQVNVLALTHLTWLFLPGMVARGRGRILNLGSTAGFQPGPYMAVYYASKAYVNHFSEALSQELKGSGVTVTVSCPGATATEFAAVAGNDKSKLFKSGVADAKAVAREAYRALHAGNPMIVHGLKNKVLMQSLRVSPRAVVRAVTAGFNKTQ